MKKVDVAKIRPFLKHTFPCWLEKYPNGWRPVGGMFYEGPGFEDLECTCGLNELIGIPAKRWLHVKKSRA